MKQHIVIHTKTHIIKTDSEIETNELNINDIVKGQYKEFRNDRWGNSEKCAHIYIESSLKSINFSQNKTVIYLSQGYINLIGKYDISILPI